MTGFERVEGRGQQPSKATIRIGPQSSSYITVGAVRRWFENVDRVTFYVDRERSRVAIAAEESEHDYALSSKDGGAHVAIKQPLRRLDVDVDDLEESFTCPLEKDDETGYVVADVSAVVEAATDDVHCPECGKRFTEHGLSLHVKKTHDETYARRILEEADADDIGEPAPEGDDSWREKYDRAEDEEAES